MSFFYLFKSDPAMLVLEFPTATPSGFSIGTILNIKISLSLTATWSEDSKNVMNPLQTIEEGVSNGCYLANIKIIFLFEYGKAADCAVFSPNNLVYSFEAVISSI